VLSLCEGRGCVNKFVDATYRRMLNKRELHCGLMLFYHFGHISGSPFPDHVRDRLQLFGLIAPSFEIPANKFDLFAQRVNVNRDVTFLSRISIEASAGATMLAERDV